MRDLLQLCFEVTRQPSGSYSATCRELGVRVEAPTLPVFESKLSAVANAVLSEPGADPVAVIVRRVFPPQGALA